MLTDEQNNLLLRYRDFSYIMTILTNESSSYYSKIRHILNIPLILSSSIMVVFNSSNDNNENVKIMNIILNISTSLILSSIASFQLNEKILTFNNASKKFMRLVHEAEDNIFNIIDDDVTTEDLHKIIETYDNINESVEYSYPEHLKNRLIKKFKGIKPLPHVLNCTCQEAPTPNNSQLVTININE